MPKRYLRYCRRPLKFVLTEYLKWFLYLLINFQVHIMEVIGESFHYDILPCHQIISSQRDCLTQSCPPTFRYLRYHTIRVNLVYQ